MVTIDDFSWISDLIERIDCICESDSDINDSTELLEMEYSIAYSKCLLPICDVDHTLSPTQTKKPTKFTWPTPEPTTLSPSLNPIDSPTKTWWS